MGVGSHTVSHGVLKELDAEGVVREMRSSKEQIEQILGIPCLDFAPPMGVPNLHFDSKRDPVLAKSIGYRSFLTNSRGAMRGGDSPYFILRDHMIAKWGSYQLRYFFSV